MMFAYRIADAADAIVRLINARVTSPTNAEIEGLLAEHLAPKPVAVSPALIEWDALVCSFAPDDSTAREDFYDDLVAETKRILAKRAESLEDIVLLAAVSAFWNTGGGRVAYPNCVLTRAPGAALEDLTLARLVEAVLDLAGIDLDHEGRLLPGATA
jgi:hypothetical protein